MHADKSLLDCIGKFLDRDTDIDKRMRNISSDFFQIGSGIRKLTVSIVKQALSQSKEEPSFFSWW